MHDKYNNLKLIYLFNLTDVYVLMVTIDIGIVKRIVFWIGGRTIYWKIPIRAAILVLVSTVESVLRLNINVNIM